MLQFSVRIQWNLEDLNVSDEGREHRDTKYIDVYSITSYIQVVQHIQKWLEERAPPNGRNRKQ